MAWYGVDPAPAFRCANLARRHRSGQDGCHRCHTERDRETPRATATDALAELTVAEAEARLVLDWTQPVRHATFYKAIYRPAVLRANRLTSTAKLSPAQSFDSLRHTHASLCVVAGIKPGTDVLTPNGRRRSN